MSYGVKYEFILQVKSFGNTTDEYYLSATVRDVNDFFEQEMTFLSEYNNHLKEATQRADKMTSKHKGTITTIHTFNAKK
jgi:hypothetical protein